MKYLRLFSILYLALLSLNTFASAQMRDKILHSLENFARDHRIQATYELSAKGETILSGAQGYSDFEQNKRLSRSQTMPILSVTKQMTAAAILVLNDRGSLDLSKKISDYSTAFEGLWAKDDIPHYMKNISIHHLLTHSSGLSCYIGEIEVTKEGGKKKFEEDLGAFLKQGKPSFTPGSKHSYNNTNYYLLGLIIEDISGKDLASFFQSEFFDPLGMSYTSLLTFEEAIDLQQCVGTEKYPVRYFAHPSETSPKFSPAPKVSILAPGGDCGLVSNAHDLVTWNEALHHGKILSKTSYNKMLTPYFRSVDSKRGYNAQVGYGIYISTLNNGKKFYHHGTHGHGLRCDAGYIPKDDIALAIISNVLFIVPDDMASKVDFRKPENQIDITYLRNAMLESL